ncbi:hypothetical protein IEO21_02996 [Rhodonia placenta]|uniref:Uncharacterized protein n=1 Tax=Rhodonia placenta TaxID=104341 RepID=A0A8H7U4L6_9APHY|nr:hypothetical protein IEO21_02996 [Postia placenta]
MVAQTRTAGQSSPRKLKFHDKLVGKGLSTDALLKKLKALHTELADMDQEHVDVASLSAVRKELINTSVLLHKDKGVKAYAACCIADLLRLYAPDAPYTQSELRDIFQFFFRQLYTGLKGSDSPYYNEYFHLLESLSTVKSVVLVCDLPNAEELMTDIFRNIFSMVRNDLAKKIELFMADILIALIDECQSLPFDVLETVMAQFAEKNADRARHKLGVVATGVMCSHKWVQPPCGSYPFVASANRYGMDHPNYRLAVQVCNETADKLQRHVCQYFTDMIVSHSRDENFEEVEKAHELIKRLNRSCPSLLHNVVPQLEEELRVEENQIRIMATQVLGEMFADKGGADFVRKYPTTWNIWLLRKNDKAAAVRLTFVEAAKGVLVNLLEQRDAIEDALQTKLFDPDEKIRAAVCKLYSQLDYETAVHHVSESQLRAVAGRGLDKKHSVRVEAMTAIGKLFSLAYPEILTTFSENNDPAAVKHFAWIPESILHMAATTVEVKTIGEQVIGEYILPLPSPTPTSNSRANDVDEGAWTDRLLFVMKFLDEMAVNALLSLSGMKGAGRPVFERYLQACVEHNGGIIDENEEAVVNNLNAIVKRIAVTFPDPQKAVEDLLAFAKLNEGRLYKLLKTCMDTQVDLKGLMKATNEFLRRLEQSSSSLVPAMSVFLRRASLRMVNQSSIPTLIKRVQKGDPSGDGSGSSQAELIAHNAETWMRYISKHCPQLLQSHVPELAKAIADERNARLVEVCLQSLAAVANWDRKLVPSDKRTSERVSRFVMSSHARHAKFAARIMTCMKDSEDLCVQVVETMADALPEAEPELLVAHVAVLAQLALRAPDAFEQRSDVITAFILKQILMKKTEPSDAMQIDEEWIPDSAMPPQLQAKVLSLKICRNRCLAHAESESALDIARPVLKMLATILQLRGSLTANAQAEDELQAAVSLLHLACVEKYATEVALSLPAIAVTIQDPCYQVRMTFLDKLLVLLPGRAGRKLPASYNVVPFLSVHDPEADVKNKAKAYIVMAMRGLPKAVRLQDIEINFIRLLHVLAHHPDFGLTEEALPDIANYIEFYLDLVVSAENISLLFHLAMKAKTVRDAQSHTYSEVQEQ